MTIQLASDPANTPRMISTPRNRESSTLTTLITVVLIVAVLYWAREVLIPAALAILLCFILAPLADRLERLGIGRVPSVIVTTLLAGAIVAIIAWSVSSQVVELIEQLPSYRQNIREKVRDLRSQASGVFGRATEKLQDLGRDVAEAAAQVDEAAESGRVAPSPPADSAAQPIPVVVQEPRSQPLKALAQSLSPLLRPLISAGIVIVFVIFMLLEREKLRDRFIRVVGQRRMTLTTQAINEASSRISRYLVSLLALNVSYGIVVSIALSLIGLPNALLWGVLAAVLRFIPYLGPWLGASLPILLSIAVFDGWTRPLITIGMFVALELFSNNIAEPLVYGSRTGISSLAVLTGVLFWTWLWGPVGLVLATPLTVCLVVIGRYVPELEAITVLLGNEPALPEDTRVYQRLLAGDADDALRLTEAQLRKTSMEQVHREVLLPALLMAEHDHHRGAISGELLQSIRSAMNDLIDELAEIQWTIEEGRRAKAPDAQPAEIAGGKSTSSGESTASGEARPVRVLCLPARTEADELACRMLAQSAAGRNVHFDNVSSRMLTAEMVEHASRNDYDVVVISALPPVSLAAARRLLAELDRTGTDRRLVIGLWGARDMEQLVSRLHLSHEARAISSFDELLQQIDELSNMPRANSGSAAS
jgi:predicted PurR-regulated permease PerM